MKKFTLKSLAIIGINVGLLCSGCKTNGAEQNQMTPEMRSFYEMLDPSAQKKFLELDNKHRKAAMSIMDEMACGSPHECKGHRERAVEQQYTEQMSR